MKGDLTDPGRWGKRQVARLCLDAVNAVNDYDPKKYRVIFMKVLSALLGLIFAVQVVVALSNGRVSLGRTGKREVFSCYESGVFLDQGRSFGSLCGRLNRRLLHKETRR